MKKNKWIKDQNLRSSFKKYEIRRLFLKYLLTNQKVDKNLQKIAQKLIAKLPKKSYSTRYRNLCMLTGRSRGVYRFFNLSRLKIKELGSQGKIPGLRQSSW